MTFIALLLLAAPALAQDPAGASPSPSVDQYRESVPTDRGSVPTSRGGRQPGANLPSATRRAIETEGGTDADALEAITTDPGLGAPADTPRGARSSRAGGNDRGAAAARGAAGRVASRGILPAAVDASFDTGSGAIGLLLLGLAGTAVAVGAVALSRRRSSSV